jgi:hypothetical protein
MKEREEGGRKEREGGRRKRGMLFNIPLAKLQNQARQRNP